MKQALAKIYRDLSAGKLSQQEALERIKALKQPQRNNSIGMLFASPGWELATLSASSKVEMLAYAQHHIFLCDLPQIATVEIESLIPQSRCTTVRTVQSGNVAEAYSGVALAYFETIQRLL